MPARTRVLLIRHGATVLSAEDRFAGRSDVALSEEGAKQAALLGARLSRTCQIAAVYASPMSRTVATAKAIAGPLGLEIRTDPALREIDHGAFEGRTRAEVEGTDEFRAWDADPFSYAPEGGESGLQVLARALPALRGIVAAHPGATVAVVSHKATIRLLVGSVLGFDLRRYRDVLDMQPASLTILDMKLEPALVGRLQAYNDTTHYDGDPEARLAEARLSALWKMA